MTRDPDQVLKAAELLHQIVKRAKDLGAMEAGYKADPNVITKADLDKFDANLKTAIADFTSEFLRVQAFSFGEEMMRKSMADETYC